MIKSLLSVPLAKTTFLSPLLKDYIQKDEKINPLINYQDFKVEDIIKQRKKFPFYRKELTNILQKQNQDYLAKYLNIASNISQLAYEKTFSVCTAHQPHIGMGPLYTIYKTIHTIKLAKYLKKKYPSYHFVPVFFMGSEDADKGELLELLINKKAFRYETWEKGAVGRICNNNWQYFSDLISAYIKNTSAKNETFHLLNKAYQQENMSSAFRYLLTTLFGDEGLVILDSDDAKIKEIALPIFKSEITQRQNISLSNKAATYIDRHYGTHQLQVSESNLFHLDDDSRTKIKSFNNKYIHPHFKMPISDQIYWKYMQQHPQTISPNAVLRTVLQEHLLPNVAFVGGSSEIAYWLQLKEVFTINNTHFPYLVLRPSFTLLNEKLQLLLKELDITLPQIVKSSSFNFSDFASDSLSKDLSSIEAEQKKLICKIQDLHNSITHLGFADGKQLKAFEAKTSQFYKKINTKIFRQQKASTHLYHIQQLHNDLFPFGKLQERTLSFIEASSTFGINFVHELLQQEYNLTYPTYNVLTIP